MVIPQERLTERAQAALVAAEQEARGLDHNYIGQEHLLLGLIRDEDAMGFQVLALFGQSADRVRAAVSNIVKRGDKPSAEASGYTLRAKKAFELALDEARRLNHYYVGTEHLLLGMLREGTGIGAGVLNTLGISLAAARAEVGRVVAKGAERKPWLKRYNLALPNDLFEAVQQLADRQDTTVLEVLRRFIRLGLFMTKLQETPGSTLIIREEDRERQLVLI
ncbi:MAG: Clp protease N-terminal domain-containing protein [Dehalococcoidia bacterium]